MLDPAERTREAMKEMHVGPIPDGAKRCVACAEPINQDAGKCIHCQSAQGGVSRYVGFSSTVLSLLVALVSVTTAMVPVIKDALTPKDSSLQATFQSTVGTAPTILISNQGIRSGSVNSVSLKVVNGGGDNADVALGLLSSSITAETNKDLPLLVNPTQSMLLVLGRKSDRVSPSLFKNGTTCTISISVTSFSGITDELPISTIQCPQVQTLATG
jgi:hypothetical protein